MSVIETDTFPTQTFVYCFDIILIPFIQLKINETVTQEKREIEKKKKKHRKLLIKSMRI